MPHGWAKPISAISAISAGRKNSNSAGNKKHNFCGKYIICEITFSVFPLFSVSSVVEKIEKNVQNVGSFEKMR
jgi:hypothetical protein